MAELLLLIFIIIILSIVGIFNRFVRLQNKIKQSRSGIEVYLNQRFDLIPNLVECVKAYTNYEERVFVKIAELRSQFENSANKDLKKGSELNNICNSLLAVGENNPSLKASEHFLKLQSSLNKMENQLQAARRVYNGDVTLYNTTISTFPNNIFADMFGFSQEELFEIEEYKKENIKLDL